MKYKRYSALLLALLLILSLFTACGGDGGESTDDTFDGSLHNKDGLFSLGYDPDYGLNPYSITDINNLNVSSLMYDNVFEVDSSFRVSSRIIEEYSTEDGLWWVFTVDTTIPFHDGSTLTAYDVAYSLKKAVASAAYKSRLSNIYGISALSGDMFAISLNSANMQLPALLTVPVIKDGSAADNVPCGTGPYMLSTSADSLVAFQNYYATDTLPIKTIYLKSYEDRSDMVSKFGSSTIDMMFNEPLSSSPIECKSAFSSHYYNLSNLHFLGFNEDSPFFTYKENRKAMNYVVDRSMLVTDIFDSCATETMLPIHPASPYYNKELAASLEYNVKTAKTVLKNAGVQDYDNDGMLEFIYNGNVTDTDLTFIVCNANSKKIYAARQIALDLRNMGFNVVLNELSWNDYIQALEDGNYDIYYGEIKLTADFNLSALLCSYGQSNYFNRDATNYDAHIFSYLTASDENRAMQADLMCKYIAEDAVMVPICFGMGEIITSSGMVSDITASQYDVFYNIEAWSITLK